MSFFPTPRLFGVDVAVFAVTPQEGAYAGTAYNLLGQFQNLSVEFDADTQDNAAVQDLWDHPVIKRQRWHIPVTTVVEGFDATPNAYHIARFVGLQVFVIIDNTTNGGVRWSGYALVLNFRQQMGEGAQTLSFDLVGQGELAADPIAA
jgi:hypothetical protein